MQELRRVTAGEYTIEEAVPLLQLLEEQEPEKHLRGVDTMFRNHEAVTLTANQEKRCRCGNSFSVKIVDGTYRAYIQSSPAAESATAAVMTASTTESTLSMSARIQRLSTLRSTMVREPEQARDL